MMVKVGELKIDKKEDYYGEVVKALEDKGFFIIKEFEDFGNALYIIAKKEEN